MTEELQEGAELCCDLAEQEGGLSPVLCQSWPSLTVISLEQAWGQTPFLCGHLGACVWISGLGSGLVPISGVVALTYLCPRLRHWNSSPTAQQRTGSALSRRHSLLGFPAPSAADRRKRCSFRWDCSTTGVLPRRACPGCASPGNASGQTSEAGFPSLPPAATLPAV